MLKVFFVEDETKIREEFKQKIEWEKHGLCVVGEAGDGEIAYPLIKDTKPDILITDLMMPYMDGLELSGLVKKDLPDIKIIMLSDYAQFFYAKSALRIGVSNYLMKPVNTSELLDTVLDIKTEILKKHEQKWYLEFCGKECEERVKMERHQFFEDLISGKYSVPEMIARGMRFDVNLAANAYNMILFEFWDKEQECTVQTEDVEQKLYNMFKGNEWLVYFDRGIEGKAVLMKGRNERELKREVVRFTKELSRVFQNIGNLRYFAGVGKTITRLCDIPECYFQANRAFNGRFFNEESQVIFSSKTKNIRAGNDAEISLQEIDMEILNKKRIEDFLKSGSRKEVEAVVDEFWRQVDTGNMDSVLFRQYILMDGNFTAIRFLEKNGGNKEHAIQFITIMKEIAFVAISRELTKAYMRKVLILCLKARDEISISRYNELVGMGKDYILKHYNEESISLNMVAAQVNVTPNHFSSVFRQKEGLTFVEYLIKIRLDKAKEMLRCTGLNTTEIGKSLGYRDGQYFCYQFKKSFGCTPGEYRMRGVSPSKKCI